MLSPSEFKEVTSAVTDFLAKASADISFERGDPQKYFETFSQINAGLTLPIVSPQQRVTVVKLKNFYALWNFLVDDEMDRRGTCRHLDASMQVLLDHSRGVAGLSEGSRVAELMGAILKELPVSPSLTRSHLHELLLFDLWAVLSGFKYEYCLGKKPQVANSLEYRKYTTQVATFEHYLDLDCLFADRELAPTTYSQLRKAYEHLGQALKLASDIGSLKRELMEENNLNLVRILAAESGVFRLEQKVEREEEFEELRPRLQPTVLEVRRLATEQMEAASALMSPLDAEVDTQLVRKTASRMMQGYFERDLYFWK
jgi:hypothetical protein